MQRLTNLFNRFALKRVLGVLLAAVLLFATTACNNGTETGARPYNPPVQMGGNNNPRKSGGDGYTGFKASTDPRMNANTSKSISPRADAGSFSTQKLIAAKAIDPSVNNSQSNLLYPGSKSSDRPGNAPEGVTIREQFKQDSEESGIASNSDVLQDSKENLLEKVGDTFKDASAFLKDKAEESYDRPEMQANPAVQRKS